MLHHCVIGLGETGASIVALLIQKYPNSIIDILDPSDWIKGRLLDLAHAATINNCVLQLNNFDSLQNAEIIYYCAGIRNEKGGDRLSTVRENKQLVAHIFQQSEFQKNALIIVITNPVELIAQWISKALNHDTLVVGTGTALDQFRLRYLISQKQSCGILAIHVPVWGEHGNGMTPIYSLGRINNQPIGAVFSEKELFALTEELKQSALRIRATEKATKFGVAQCALFIADAWLGNSSVNVPLSIKTNRAFASVLGMSEDQFLSLPCAISRKHIELSQVQKVSASELNQLRNAARKLAEINTQLKLEK